MVSTPLNKEKTPSLTTVSSTDSPEEEEHHCLKPEPNEDARVQELLTAEEESLKALWDRIMERKAKLKA